MVLYDGVELDINSSTLYYIFKNEFNFKFESFSCNAPKFSKKTSRLLKELIKEQGEQAAVDIVRFAVHHWVEIQRKTNITSLPTTQAIYGYRSVIMSMMNIPKYNSVEYNGKGTNKYSKNKRANKNALFIS